jgi:hypothetical protein
MSNDLERMEEHPGSRRLITWTVPILLTICVFAAIVFVPTPCRQSP